MTKKTQTVKIRLMHKASHPGVNWVRTVGWNPTTDWADDSWTLEEGSLWSDAEEEAGLAVSGYHDVQNVEGDVIGVSIDDVHWRSCGDCRYLQGAKIGY